MNKIGIFSVPRSGSTWLGQIFNSCPNVMYKFQPNFAYSFEGNLKKDSSKNEIDLFFKRLQKTEDPFVNAKISISSKENIIFDKEFLNTLVFKETHYIEIIENLLEKTDVKIIGLVRSPFSVINSWVKIPKEFNPEWNILDEWKFAPSKNKENEHYYFGFEKWKKSTQLFLKLKNKYQDSFYLLNYDDLLKNTKETIENLFDFCELELTEQTKLFLSNSKKENDTDAYSVFKNKINDNEWMSELPVQIIEEIKRDKEFIELNKELKWI